MARSAVARETVFALRREIARIEGLLPERLENVAAPAPHTLVRQNGRGVPIVARTGSVRLDAALCGGLPLCGLSEVHAPHMRDGGALAGFALAWIALADKARGDGKPSGPVLWISSREIAREAGRPYPPALSGHAGLAPRDFLFAFLEAPLDALAVAEEAVRIGSVRAVVLELGGMPKALDLTATRRLNLRAQEAGRPLLLLRLSAVPQPTAAPLRLIARPAPAGLRHTIAAPLPGSIGPPRFRLVLDKSPDGRNGEFLLEWKAHEHSFCDIEPASAGDLVSTAADGSDLARQAGQVMAFPAPRFGAAGAEPSRQERPEDRGPRRTG